MLTLTLTTISSAANSSRSTGRSLEQRTEQGYQKYNNFLDVRLNKESVSATAGLEFEAIFIRTTMLNNYHRNGRLEGHSGPVYCLAATDDGRFLASGGKDSTRTWDLISMTQISNRPASSGKRGATTALTWANRDDEPGENLFYGTVTGFLICWRKAAGQQSFHEVYCKRIAQDSEITSLAFDALSNRLAVCTYNSLVQVYVLSSAPAPRKLWGIGVNNFLPKSIVFGVMRGNEREILAFGIHDGRIRTFTGSEEADSHLESWEIGTCIGDAIVDNRRVTVCIDDIESGPVLYRLDDHQRIKTFSVPVTIPERRPRQVRFVDDSKAIVIGSDHGVVYVFDRRSGEVIDKLLMKGQDWVQSIATADCNNVATIFAAKSGDGVGPNDIIMWQKTADRRSPGTIVCEGILVLIQGAILLASFGYAYQNMDVLEGILKTKFASFFK